MRSKTRLTRLLRATAFFSAIAVTLLGCQFATSAVKIASGQVPPTPTVAAQPATSAPSITATPVAPLASPLASTESVPAQTPVNSGPVGTLPASQPIPAATNQPLPIQSPAPAGTTLPNTGGSPSASVASLMPVFDDVVSKVTSNYVYQDYHKHPNWKDLAAQARLQAQSAPNSQAFYTILTNLLAQLNDPALVFETPDQVAAAKAGSQNAQNTVGIGIRITAVQEGLLVDQVVPDGPAGQAGIQSRDLIVAVDGASTANAVNDLSAISAKIRGAEGSSLNLTVRTPGQADRNITLTRRAVSFTGLPQVVAQRLRDGKTGYLQIFAFQNNLTAQQTRDALTSLLKGGPITGLIVDIRTGPGPDLQAVLDTLSVFASSGQVGSMVGRTQTVPLAIASGSSLPSIANTPIVVLISHEDNSVDEIFAAGLKSAVRARFVGEPTAGSTEVDTTYDEPDGSQLQLPELVYRLPGNASIEGVGLNPDSYVKAAWYLSSFESDPQIQAAAKLLNP